MLLVSRRLIFPLIADVVEFPSLDEGSSYTHCAQVCKYSHIRHVGPFHKKDIVFQAQYGQLLWEKHHNMLIIPKSLLKLDVTKQRKLTKIYVLFTHTIFHLPMLFDGDLDAHLSLD